MRVLAKQNRTGKPKYYRGIVIGRQTFMREKMSIFDNPPREYQEDKLLVKMSDGSTISVWESEVFRVVEAGQLKEIES